MASTGATNPFLAKREAETINLVIHGQPQGWARPRFNGRTGVVFNKKGHATGLAEIRRAWEEAGQPRIEDTTAIELDVFITVQRPRGHLKADGSLSAEGQRNPKPRKSKPDIDNVLKLVMDALNKRAYFDDVRVARATVERDWADWPSTTIVIRPFP